MEALIEELGSGGPFQILLILATQSTILCSVCGMMMMAFGSYNPGWRCADDVRMFNSTTDSVLLTSANPSVGSSSWNLTKHLDPGVCNASRPCRHVVFEPGSSTVVTEWGLICEKSWTLSLIITVQMTGVLMGSYLVGQLGDRFGRKVALYAHVALHGIVNVIAIFSESWQMFAVIRFFIGLGIGGILSSSFYPMEFLSQRGRGIFGALPIWFFGMVLFAVIVFVLKDWRTVHASTAALSFLVLLPAFWTPESIRWLVVHRNLDKAKAVTVKMARLNRRKLPGIHILEDIARDERMHSPGNKQYTYIDLFRNRALRRVTISTGIIWVCLSVIYYAIGFGVKSLHGDFYVNFLISSVSELPGMTFVGLAANTLGRRWGSVVHFAVASSSCFIVVCVTLFSPDGVVKDYTVCGLAIFAKMVTLAAWQIVAVFCIELFPTVVRGLGAGYLSASARLGGIIAPYLISGEDSQSLWVAFLVMGSLMAVCCGIILSLSETKGRPLADTMTRRLGKKRTPFYPPLTSEDPSAEPDAVALTKKWILQSNTST